MTGAIEGLTIGRRANRLLFVLRSQRASLAALLLLAILGSSCASSGPHPAPAEPSPPAAADAAAPPPGGPPTSSSTDLLNVRAGASDSVGSLPGSPDALYRFRFIQIIPASDRFTFQDRDLSFYFKPTPDAVHFQIENRTSRPVWIDWDKTTFFDPEGRSGKTAHATSVWRDRYANQSRTQISGLQRYSDYLFPMDYLVDPAGRDEQLHRALFPEDSRAPTFADREFGVQLSFVIEDRPRTYDFRFRVASVIPR